MSYPSFEDEVGANAPWWQLPFVVLFWAFAVVLVGLPIAFHRWVASPLKDAR